MQDSKGFIWFGTWNGLCKYDGYTFTTYQFDLNDTSSIGGNVITRIFEDHNGIIWVIARGSGIYLFDRTTEKFTRFQPKIGTLSTLYSFSWVLNEDKEGNIWTGNDKDGQLVRYNKLTGTLEDYTSEIFTKQDSKIKKDQAISSIYKDKQGTLWIGSSHGLHRLNLIPQGERRPSKVSFTTYLHDPKNPQTLAGNNIGVIYEDRTGMLWVNSDGIINLWDPKLGSCIKKYIPNPKDPNAICCDEKWGEITEDKAGNMWFSTVNVLNKLNKERTSFTRYEHNPNDPTSINGHRIIGLYLDNSNVLWITTIGGGLDKLDLNQKAIGLYRHNPFDNRSLSNNNVSAICEDKFGIVWLGTIGGGVNAWNKQTNTFTHYRDHPSKRGSIGSDSISAIIEDREGNLWAGGGKNYTGILSRFDWKTGAFKNYSFKLPFENTYGNPVLTLYEDRQGFIWAGTTCGASRFNPKTETWIHYPYDPKNPKVLSSHWINAIYEDNRGNFWLANNIPALDKLDPITGKISHYTPGPKDSGNISLSIVKNIFKDSKGVPWFATRLGGLFRLNEENGTFTAFTKRDGLPSNTIYSIVEDDDGNLWLTTNKGLCRFSPSTRTCTIFDKDDGLQSNQFEIRAENVGGCFKGKDGTLYFGGPNGLNVFHPHNLHTNKIVPPVAITRFSLFGKPIPGNNEASEIVLNYDENFFSFEFAALNYSNSAKNQYAYRLVGVDKDWVYSGNRRLASYTAVSPGNYVFRVKASNNDGIWNEKGTSVRIIILPPWWRTWWAYLLYLLVSGSLIFLSVRSYTKRKLREQRVALEKQQAIERERMRISSELHDDLGGELSTIRLLSEINVSGTNPEQRLFKISGSSNELVQKMNEIVWALNVNNDSMQSLVSYMRRYAVKYLEDSEINCRFEQPEAIPDYPIDGSTRRNIFLLLKEALNNVVKHAGAKKVYINVVIDNSGILITVQDDGKGIPAEQLEESAGNGLRNMHQRIKDLNGYMDIKSDSGTMLHFHLPLLKNHTKV
jgi:signal transduction histidine kinase/ligand-binding sensor domain-containing protein